MCGVALNHGVKFFLAALKYCAVIGCCIYLKYCFGLHQRKKCKIDHGTNGLQKAYFLGHIIHCHGPTKFCDGGSKMGSLVVQVRVP